MKAMTGAHVAAVVAVVIGTATLLHARQSDPLSVYKEYLGVLAKADTLGVLLPYYSKELSSGLSKMPKEMQANYLKMNRRALSDVKVTKQQVDADKAYFEMTAKLANGQQTNGSATLVKEGAAWKVDDEAWVSNLPKGR